MNIWSRVFFFHRKENAKTVSGRNVFANLPENSGPQMRELRYWRSKAGMVAQTHCDDEENEHIALSS